MAAFTSTSILSPSQHLQLQRHLPLRASFLSPNSLSTLRSPPNNKQLNCFDIRAAATPLFADTDVHDFASTSFTTSWGEFAENVSGEWDGFGADFTVQGEPIELPEMVVPEAYREWEVKVFDWQTQCPTLAQSHNNCPSLMYKTIKLLPTVGCEADAATRYSIQERNITAQHKSAFAYQSTGCYVASWPTANQIDSANKSMQLEHCLIDPTDKESRVRIIQNGDQLGGCAIRDSAFAATQPLKASQVSGVWQGLAAVAGFNTSQTMIQQLGDECVRKSIRDEADLILLPKQLWCSLKCIEDKETCCEVDGCWEIAIASETATPV
ncbi:hypothetical protein Sango_0546900 [Sesamum angolense]|uniref:Uncharacterized protein n=1 Tax=Sesamum angolense TaxID=2727404 RepID=A0AAE1X621_9LAMI|nr:hypothetical protein Sango_0546900 [Sesamum angolense]